LTQAMHQMHPEGMQYEETPCRYLKLIPS